MDIYLRFLLWGLMREFLDYDQLSEQVRTLTPASPPFRQEHHWVPDKGSATEVWQRSRYQMVVRAVILRSVSRKRHVLMTKNMLADYVFRLQNGEIVTY